MSVNMHYIDYHVHTEYSPDASGSFMDYCLIAEENGIQLGFLDHFDITRQISFLPVSRVPAYLEDFERVRSNFPGVSIGLEIEYTPSRLDELASFLRDYRGKFDRYVGAVHFIFGKPATIRSSMERLLSIYPFEKIEQEYFRLLKSAVQSRLFDGIAHPDVIFRYVNDLVDPKYESSSEMLTIGKLCKRFGVKLELNIRGKYHPVGRTYPPLFMVNKLMKEGVEFFIGSDSHSVEQFSNMKMDIIEINKILNRLK